MKPLKIRIFSAAITEWFIPLSLLLTVSANAVYTPFLIKIIEKEFCDLIFFYSQPHQINCYFLLHFIFTHIHRCEQDPWKYKQFAILIFYYILFSNCLETPQNKLFNWTLLRQSLLPPHFPDIKVPSLDHRYLKCILREEMLLHPKK